MAIDVEDTFDGKLLIGKKNIRSIPVNIHLDYYTHPKKKYIKVFFRNGYYIADFAKKKFVIKKDGLKKIKFFKFENNFPFKEEVKFFIKAIMKKKVPDRLSLQSGIDSLKLVNKLKKFKNH